MGSVTMGLDVGQKVDPTAIAVVELEDRSVERPDGKRRVECHHIVRHLERLPLGTKYPAVSERIVAIARAVAGRTGVYPRLYVDATGVGQPVLDILNEAGVQATVTGVYFTHGDRRKEEEGGVKLGKAWLVSRLQALLQTGRLHLPQTAEARATGKELLDYEIRVDEDANDRYGAFKTGAHDDLVTAVGLATQDDGGALPFSWMDDQSAPADSHRAHEERLRAFAKDDRNWRS